MPIFCHTKNYLESKLRAVHLGERDGMVRGLIKAVLMYDDGYKLIAEQ